MNDDRNSGWQTFTEEIEVTGQQLLNEINRLIAEGNVHKLNVKSADGEVFLSIPLTGGVVAGGIVALTANSNVPQGCSFGGCSRRLPSRVARPSTSSA